MNWLVLTMWFPAHPPSHEMVEMVVPELRWATREECLEDAPVAAELFVQGLSQRGWVPERVVLECRSQEMVR